MNFRRSGAGGAGCALASAWTPRRRSRLQMKWGLGLGGGTLICNPVAEADEIPAAEMAGPIAAAVAEAAQLGVTGKAVTPHVLARIVELTKGRSLRTNIAL